MLTNVKLLEEENQKDNKKTARLKSISPGSRHFMGYLPMVAQGLRPLFEAMLRKDLLSIS